MKRTACYMLLLCLSGCTTARLIPPGVSGTAASVTISNTWGVEEAWPYAVEHCRKFGKVPGARRSTFFATLVFDCVAPS
jgi:hypothetical protein